MRKAFTYFLICLLSFSCTRDLNTPTDSTPQFLSFEISHEKNPKNIQKDLAFKFTGDHLSARTTRLTDIHHLIPSFETNAVLVTSKGKPVLSGSTAMDFTRPVEYELTNENGATTIIKAELTNFTNLPVIRIQTEGKQPINSKEDYVAAKITLQSPNQKETFQQKVQIKGHGNSTWVMPKKPYKFKFDHKQALLGMPAAKPWLLLANWYDTSALRTSTSMAMGKLSHLSWTPKMRYTELFLNGIYQGTYQLSEQVKINKNRVNISDDGYLLEIDQPDRLSPDDISFETAKMLVVIKDPDIAPHSDRYQFIKDYVNKVESVLYSDQFMDPENGYAKYLDVESFVDWYLINEITKNNDAIFYSSCYMHLPPGGKLTMGPIWDFDLALGNVNYNNNDAPEGFWVKNAVWISRLFEDPAFVQKVKDRFKFFQQKQGAILDSIEQNAQLLHWAAIENNYKWHNLDPQSSAEDLVSLSFDQHKTRLIEWFNTRMEWLNTAFSLM